MAGCAAPLLLGALVTAPVQGAAAQAQDTTIKVHTIGMIGDAQGYRFSPAELTIKTGDGVRFVLVRGGPHAVWFSDTTLVGSARTQLSANMTGGMGELTTLMMVQAGESYTVSFTGMPVGVYQYSCLPHMAMNMRGRIIVK